MTTGIIILFFIAILVAMGSALFFLVRDRSGEKRTVQALTVRIALSVALIVFLFLCFHFGWIHPHGVRP